MRIIDGNIFEGMRLVLPEHRELMERSKQESKKRTQPILSEDEWDQLEYMIGEALQHRRRVRITLFDPFQDIVWEGIPLMKNGKLYLQWDEGTYEVPLQRLLQAAAIQATE